MSETQTILCINSGSSSLKFRVYEMGIRRMGRDTPKRRSLAGTCRGAGGKGRGRGHRAGRGASLVRRRRRGFDRRAKRHEDRHEPAIELALTMLADDDLPSIEAVGHRMVHGGPHHFAPALLTPALIDDLPGILPGRPCTCRPASG